VHLKRWESRWIDEEADGNNNKKTGKPSSFEILHGFFRENGREKVTFALRERGWLCQLVENKILPLVSS
jgi:hypothetical protein